MNFVFDNPFPCRDFPLKGKDALIKIIAKFNSLIIRYKQNF
jgi:hypothetical protein